MNKLLVLAADLSQLASLPAAVIARQGLPRVVGSHPSRMLSCGPRRSTAIIDQFVHSRALTEQSVTACACEPLRSLHRPLACIGRLNAPS